jgi:hypothetical protein
LASPTVPESWRIKTLLFVPKELIPFENSPGKYLIGRKQKYDYEGRSKNIRYVTEGKRN